MDQDTFLTTLYVLVDDFCQSAGFAQKHRPGPAASLSCSEVVRVADEQQPGARVEGLEVEAVNGKGRNRKCQLRQHVCNALRDPVDQQVQMPRDQCLRCQRMLQVYPEGTRQAQTSQRMKGLAVMLSLLGLSYGAVSLA